MMKQELIRAFRLNIAAEHEAIQLYAAHAEATDDELVVAESLCPRIGAPQPGSCIPPPEVRRLQTCATGYE